MAKPPEWLTFGLSPTRLFNGVGELSTEIPLRQPWSIIGITAYGKDTAAWNIDFGVQGRYYGIGTAETGGFLENHNGAYIELRIICQEHSEVVVFVVRSWRDHIGNGELA